MVYELYGINMDMDLHAHVLWDLPWYWYMIYDISLGGVSIFFTVHLQYLYGLHI